ncbi:hypothetical protein CANARDRAFT_8825 [[Candida] arabinofermentans NRRL YB-2248]|uniref:Uncharacterized protein n=1 Tax=[Candida] arabinofermentans NRRL YB-2248 TaxID=983967 RepID=A0A1E4SXE2_9ASCO|nr:hypothetical protein CANARDRAFT_8825 [[Candida] arabinofermentans NRRL YB-2248]
MSSEQITKSYILDSGPLPKPSPELSDDVLSLFSLKGKVAVVTGASKGIGFAIAEAYASAGATVIIYYNSTPVEAKVEYLKKKYGVQVKEYKCQVDNMKEIAKTTELVLEEFGKIDIFVANAGIAWDSKDILNIEDDEEAALEWKKLFQVDVDSVHYCARSIGKVFKKQGYGSFIVTASISAHIVNIPQFQAPYNSCKAAVLHYAKSIAIEWAGFARVNTISPGYVKTEMVENLPKGLMEEWCKFIPLGRLALPKELVGAYLYLASDASTYCTGTDIKIDGGYCSI